MTISFGASSYDGLGDALKSRRQAAASPPKEGPASVKRTRTILLIDDSLTFRALLSEWLRAEGFCVVLASSGEEGCEVVETESVDAVVVDLQMPGIDGLETCRRIRRRRGAAALPILLLTASDDLAARMSGRGAGADEYLLKSSAIDGIGRGVADFVRRTSPERPRKNVPGPAARPESAAAGERPDLLAAVVAATGLSRLIAESVIERACRRAGVDVARLTAAELARALPEVERSIKMFVRPEELEARLAAIAALAERRPGATGAK